MGSINPGSTWYLVLLTLVYMAGTPYQLVAQSPTTSRDAWVRESPAGETGCAFGTPFHFFHRQLSGAEDLLIYFQGGGACWDWLSCSGLFDTSVSSDELREFRGIFDRSNIENPFRNFGIVFVPYCTGDVHVGAATRQYGDDSTSVVAHNGHRNVTAVLEWLTPRAQPRRVVVAGASAGSYGALFYAPAINRLFPDATVIMIGDSGVPLLHEYPTILEHWGAPTVLRAIWQTDAPPPNLLAAHAYASVQGTVRLAQITSDRDAIQSAFYLISGSPRWRHVTYQMLDTLGLRFDNFRSFIVSGADHGLLRTDRFYQYEEDGVSLREWVARLIDGEPLRTVRCEECVIQ